MLETLKREKVIRLGINDVVLQKEFAYLLNLSSKPVTSLVSLSSSQPKKIRWLMTQRRL